MKELIEEIERAWEGVKYPGDENIFTRESYDDEGIVDYFTGTSWNGHSTQSLRAHCAAISSFFTPEAWHYWLPAYLVAAITDYDELSQGVESITCSLREKTYKSEEKIALLNNSQKIALVHFYEFLINLYPEGESSQFTREEREVLYYLYQNTSLS